jgi:hypothetical protein
MSKSAKRKPLKVSLEVSHEGYVKLRLPSFTKTLTAKGVARRGGKAGIDAELAKYKKELARVLEETGLVDLGTVHSALRIAGHRLKAPWLAEYLFCALEDLLRPVRMHRDNIRAAYVSQARSEGLTWEDSYDRASEMATEWGFAAGSAETMRQGYKEHKRIEREKERRRRRVG